MLQPRTAIFNVEPSGFSPAKRRISLSSGRLRKNNVLVNCLRLACRQTSRCKIVPYERMGGVSRSFEGSRLHSHMFRRKYRLTGDLVRTSNSASVIIKLHFTSFVGMTKEKHRRFSAIRSLNLLWTFLTLRLP